jgi:hypothetical protein
MQQIRIERWTFFFGILALFAGYLLTSILGPALAVSSATSLDLGGTLLPLSLVLFLLSYAFGGPAQPKGTPERPTKA